MSPLPRRWRTAMYAARCPARRRRSAGAVLAVLIAGTVASCTAQAPAPGNPSSQIQGSPTTTQERLGALPRPDCLPGPASFANVPTGTERATPVALIGDRGRRGVVLGAQSNGGICQMVSFGSEVAGHGYRVALFEWGGDNTDAMAAAVRVLAADGATRIVVGGFSEGAVIGLGAARTLGARVAGVLAVSGGPSTVDGYPTIASLSGFRGPLLLISARGDPVFPPGTDAAIAAAHHGRETVLTLDGYDHALLLLEGDHSQRVRQAIFTFLRSVLQGP